MSDEQNIVSDEQSKVSNEQSKVSDEQSKVSDEQNIIYIGSKPVMSYVLAVITSFSSPTVQEVVLKARGRSITTAVDVAEITRRRFMKQLNVNGLVIGTEDLPQQGGGTRAVSTIEINLKKGE